MILVTLGTQKQSFKRLLNSIEKSHIVDEIIVQAGYTKFKSQKMKILEFIPYEEMSKLIKECDLVITHGGTGSIVMPLKEGKKIIAAPRLSKYQEHVDDHQTQIVDVFSEEGYILAFNDGNNLDEIYAHSKKFKPKKFISNTDNFINNLQKEIDH